MGGLGAPEIILLLFVAGGFWLLPLFIGYSMGSKRTIGGLGGLLLGFFLSYLGIVILAFIPRNPEMNFYNFNTPSSSADELKKYKDLLDSGAISEQEYQAQKAKILYK